MTTLNAAQHRAVHSDSPRLLVIAGAGSGKTTVLAQRVARLIRAGTAPDRLLAVTFTRAAAAEMRERIDTILSSDGAWHGRLPDIRTLHSWGASLIRQHAAEVGRTRDFTIYDDVDKSDIVRSIAMDFGDDKARTRRFSTLWRQQEIRDEYERRLQEGNALDYDMIEALTLRLLRSCPAARQRWVGAFRHVFVDEYQDTNLAQVAICDELLPANIFIVGDPRQSIYRFRGAEPATIIAAASDADFEVVELTKNYRSGSTIVALANHCVHGPWLPMEAAQSDPGEIAGHRSLVEPIVVAALLRERHERGVPWGGMAVLGRMWGDHAQPWKRRGLAKIRDHLVRVGIPCTYCGGDDDPWNSEDGRALARCIRLARNPHDRGLAALVSEWGAMGRRRFDDIRRLRVRAMRTRTSLVSVMVDDSAEWSQFMERLGETPHSVAVAAAELLGDYRARALTSRLETVAHLADELQRFETLADFCSWWSDRSVQERIREAVADRTVTITTVHGAKGLEWDSVVLTDCRAGTFPTDRRSATADDRAEDLRVFYVGLTRARGYLALTMPEVHRPPWGHATACTPTPFVGPHVPLPTWEPAPWGGTTPAVW